MNPKQLIAKAFPDKVRLSLVIKKIDEDEQVVYGEVYAPYVIDSHGDMMLPEDVKKLAHRFIAMARNSHIDVMHNNKPAMATAVESFVARDGDPTYTDGAWVLASKIYDKDLWADIKSGKYNGYSMEAMVIKEEAIVEISVMNQVFGFTEKASGHDHAYYVQIDDSGTVMGGTTSIDDGHSHVIRAGTATDTPEGKPKGHKHRYFLP